MEWHVRKSEKIVAGGKGSKSGQRAERRRAGREGGREVRGRSERMEKCGDIAAERMV